MDGPWSCCGKLLLLHMVISWTDTFQLVCWMLPIWYFLHQVVSVSVLCFHHTLCTVSQRLAQGPFFVYMFMIIWCSSFPNFPVTILTFVSISAFSIDVATGSSCWHSCDITLLIKVNSRLKLCSSSRCCHQWFFSKNFIKCSENLLWTWWLLKSEVCFIDFL